MTEENKIYSNLSHWISGEGPDNEIVLSSRVRLARNLENFVYQNKADNEVRKKISEYVKKTVSSLDLGLHYIQMTELPVLERELLVEKHLISPVHAKDGTGKDVYIDDKETVSIMVNEEDHIRLQVLKPGMQLADALEIANKIDDKLEQKMNFAFSDRWGYLSACPTNAGTGLRASVMVHLPALNFTNSIAKMLSAVSRLGLAIRGLYGEGSESIGNIYQISNQVTLGHTENDIIENISSVTSQIINQEKRAREGLMHDIKVKDGIKRSYGILGYAYQISSEEAMKLLSNVRLGIDMGIINDVDPRVLSELMIMIRPAHIQKIHGRELDVVERDVKRAELVQNRLNI